MARLVALLRGINLGSKRRVAMADLRELMAELGYEDVRTVLQSGNIVFTGAKAEGARDARSGRSRTATASRSTSSCAPWTSCTRSYRTSRSATRRPTSPVPSSSSSRASRTPPRSQTLAETDFAPDRFEAGGRELYAWCPEGMQNSALMRALGKPGLAETATVRNMSTVKKLLE